MFVREIDDQVDEGAEVDTEITFELLRLCEGVEEKEVAPSAPEGFSVLS
jgi:hypothetical protein